MNLSTLSSLNQLPIALFIKVVVLIFIGFLVIYGVFLLNATRSYNRLIVVKPIVISLLPTILAVVYLAAAISLFLVALAIL